MTCPASWGNLKSPGPASRFEKAMPLLSVPVTPEHQNLLTVVAEFVTEARERAPELAGSADREAAETMASWPRADEVRRAAVAAAQANRYLDQRTSRRSRGSASGAATGRPPPGRSFDAQALHRLGVAGLLRAGHQFDVDALVSQVAGYLAGPAEPLWRHLVLDIDWGLPTPVEIARWRLWKPSSDDWNALRPVPAAADYAADPVWDPLLSFGEHLALSAPDEQAEPTRGGRIWLFAGRGTFSSLAWEPLVLLNLWRDESVRAVAEYLVEPRRSVDRVYSDIPSTYLGPDGDYEVPQLGPLIIENAQSPQMTRFLDELSARLQRWKTAPGANKTLAKARDRLRRSAVRFLDTGDKVGFDCDVTFPQDEPQVVLSYVSALENLLSVEDENSIDLRRRAAQRAAILLGRDDAQRKIIYQWVYSAYKVRNKIAHGGEPNSGELTDATRQLRSILRRALISAIALGPQPTLSELCDEALLSHTVLHEQIQIPLEKFHATVRAG